MSNNLPQCMYTGATALTLGAVPDGTGQIWLDDVECLGTETNLFSCTHNPLGQHNCAHFEDAGVRCQAGKFCKANTVLLLA